MGAIIAILHPQFIIELDPHIFLVVFIAPLLFYDGKNSDKRSLWNQRKDIILMALALVFITVILVGFLINKLSPSISLAAAFALAAALSPTDYVAVSALSKKISLPKKVIHLIEGEGLLNDASGIVSFKFALAAALTGTFSIFDATANFVLVAIGGIIVGFILEQILIYFEIFIRNLGMEDITIELFLQILTPYIIYVISEEIFKVSGILAVVVAGMVYSLSNKRLKSKNPKLNEASENIWSVFVYMLNGLVFIMVGLQLPEIIKVAYYESTINTMKAVVDVVIITLALHIIRFLWVYLIFKFGNKNLTKEQKKANLRSAFLSALSGVRGAVTLATILSIPLFLENGDKFPERNLILFLAVGVILLTLCIATFILPMFAQKDPKEEVDNLRILKSSQVKVWENTINKLKLENYDKKYIDLTVAEYNHKINELLNGTSDYNNWNAVNKEEKKLRVLCYKKEIENTRKLLEEEKIDEQAAYSYEMLVRNKIKLVSSRENILLRVKEAIRIVSIIIFNIRRINLILKELKAQKNSVKRLKIDALRSLHIINAEYIIDYLKKNMTIENEQYVKNTILYYQRLILVANKPILKKINKAEKKRVEFKALQLEREVIQALFETGDITWNVASTLRKNLNYIESDILD
ncbi:putative cation/proton antiporter [Clostridium neonatale]|nr:putative cation/proton antiporter [Clostridium neonatale]